MANRILVLLLISAILLIIDLYILKAIKSLTPRWSNRQQNIFVSFYWGYSLLLIIGVFAGIYFNIRLTLRGIIMVAFFLTVVCKLFFLPFLFTDDIRRATIWLLRKLAARKKPILSPEKNASNIPRSEFLLKAGIAVAAVPLLSLSYGIVSGAYDYRIKRRSLYLPNLPKSFDGITLGQISDIHSGSFYNRKAVMAGVELLLAQKPDLIFFTGDLVNNKASEMKDYQDVFSKVKAPLGVYSILGNHDYGDYFYGKEPSAAKAKNLADVKTTHKNMGWDLLLNENRKIKIGSDEISIIGIENWGEGRFAKYGNIAEAVKGSDDAPVKLLLSHDPSHWRAQILTQYPDIDAMFSGHTHGMQFGVVAEKFQWSPVQYIYSEWAGLYREQQQQLYVNVGYGFIGYPGRVGVLPEITLFELRRGDIQV